MKILITGAGGFLGTEILRQLSCESNLEVVAFSSKSELPAEKLFAGNLRVCPAAQIEDGALFSGADVLINCAFPRTAQGAGLATGMDYLRTVFRAASRAGTPLINVSSQSVYDQHRSAPATEADPLCLGDSYAVAKYASELLLETCYEHAGGTAAYTNVRLASLLGPGFDQRVLNKLVKRALAGNTLTLADDGSSYGYLDVRDAAQGMVLLAKSAPGTWQRVYNLGVRQGVRLTEIGKAVEAFMERELSRSVDVVYQAKATDKLPVCTTLDASAFCRQFGWKARFSLEDTTQQVFSWELAREAHPQAR